MLQLTISFDGSWTNAFADEKHNHLFTSGNGLSEKAVTPGKKSLILGINETTIPQTETYRVVNDFTNTVKGIIARISGETRRLNAIPATHPLHAVFEKTTHEMKLQHKWSEIVTLESTKMNDVRTGGAGVVSATNLFFNGSAISHKLFSHYQLSLEELYEHLSENTQIAPWAPSTPGEFISIHNERAAYLKSAPKPVKKSSQEEIDAYEQHQNLVISIAEILTGKFETFGMIDAIRFTNDIPCYETNGFLYTAVLIAKLKELPKSEFNRLKETGSISKNGNISGVAMTGNIGGITEKDVYGSCAEKLQTNKLPYMAEVKVMHPMRNDKEQWHYTKLGVIKKTGECIVTIDVNQELEELLLEKINQADVNVFQFGKKGIAWVSDISQM